MKKILTVCVLLCIAGCFESQKTASPNIKPLDQQLIPARQDWKDAYGDTFDVQVAYNFAVLRNNQLEIAKMISKMHLPTDPNVATLEERVVLLEALEYVDPNATQIIKVDDSWPRDAMPADWRTQVRDMKSKLNEIIDWINKQ